ncbi:uncharacterized protein LOC110460876 [Mizuhopecten yessoensis]|uniref:Defense protein Hdd11-like n=1 Tax=Mizuhopecten yessoensis TaxID=6573 RepID=A0A210Q1G3_MIZYE|nr:uncharacterized protein LOC110460876 [Mizuhopecten yessoensis]OWF42581.1 defense protein Hdd11-like [Mizuhopecten yessoensis]
MWPGVIFLVLLGTTSGISGYGTGAPKVDSVCFNRLPRHGVTSQTADIPYVIRTIVTKAGGNYDITVNMTSTNGSAIKGFVVQMIPEMTELYFKDSRKPIGKFESNDDVQLLSCRSNSDTATHTNNDEKELVVIRGKIPVGGVHRKISIHATLVKRYDIFWNDVTSEVAVEPDILADDPSIEWLKLVTNLAVSYEAGQDQWEDGIKTRLKLGYYKMVDDWGHLKTKYIEEQLPFKDQFRRAEKVLDGEGKTANTSSKESIVEEFLTGSFRLKESVHDILESISLS